MKIREIIGTDLYGTSVKGIVEGFEKLGFQVKFLRVDVKDLDEGVTYIAIAQTHTKEELNHFVVTHKVRKDVFFIANPAKGNIKLSRKEFEKLFTGVLVVLVQNLLSAFKQQTILFLSRKFDIPLLIL